MQKLLALLSCCFALSAVAQTASEQIEVQNPYVRIAPPGSKVTGAFMSLHNKGEKEVALVRVEGDVAASIELHNHMSDGGVMKMRPVASIPVKAREMVELKPGSYHIMLIDLKKPLAEGDSVQLKLVFSDGSRKQVEAKVMKSMAGMDHAAHK